ncbi:sugar ABC transporter substrate-binding protein [Georgenia sp. AZ-5]|uniref:sugar ABC transporter substrate-binding protein n=1 Tax=Georgenia sp. AZ-5 TaxID=3367526 RepID=UPI0037552B9D
MRRQPSAHRARSLPALVILIVAFLTACGGANAGSSTGTTDQAGLEKAEAMVAEYSQRPTEIPNDEPITAPIPEGKRVTFISCGAPACTLEADIVRQATDQLGWSLDVINTDGTPEKVKGAWQQILRTKPDGVIYTANERAVFNDELRQATEMGISVVGCCTTDPVGDGLDFVIGTPEQTEEAGRVMGAWMVARSGGHAKTVYVDVPAFKILGSIKQGYVDTLKETCPENCTTDTLEIPITAVGKDVPDRIVSYLRAHPDVKYVAIATESIAGGLPAAMNAAGLNDVVVIGNGPDETTLQYVTSGQREATTAFAYYEEMFSLVDALARKFAGVPMEKEVVVPEWILTEENIPDDTKLFPLVEDNNEQYFELWGVTEARG